MLRDFEIDRKEPRIHDGVSVGRFGHGCCSSLRWGGQFRGDISYREDRGWRLDSTRQLRVAASIEVFLFFLALIPVRLRKDWRSHGAYAASIISLLAKMFGFQLSVYFLSGMMGMSLLEKDFMLYTYGMPVGSLVTLLGVFLIILGWREIAYAA